jgi:hypothetical protein
VNKTKRVAWHKHLKREHKAKDKAVALAHARTIAARAASGTHAQPVTARTPRPTTPRP